ncbi:hypothetical protein IBX73_02255 [candidate division WOR-3 bacterium]|nr:hypothetical protein [candidate division WOR-3 bacterium]
MKYLLFSFWFIIVHAVSYVIAGMLALKISGDLYRGENRLLDFTRDMSDEDESRHVQKYFIPAQLLRGLLMSIVFYPVLGLLGGLPLGLRFAFLFGLMFIFTDFASAVPFPDNIEGFVYMRRRYLKKDSFWKLYFETAIYSLLFALLASKFLF